MHVKKLLIKHKFVVGVRKTPGFDREWGGGHRDAEPVFRIRIIWLDPDPLQETWIRIKSA